MVASAEAGVGEDFTLMIERLDRGELPACGESALAQSGVVVTEDPAFTCADCPLATRYDGRRAMTARLESRGKVYGLFTAYVPAHLVADKEEQSLFQEVAADISFALHSIELDDERKQAEKKLKEYSERLEEMVEERTQELQDAQERLVRREKLAILGQLSGGVGHELRNPLGVISNAVYYLNMTLPDADETTKEYLDIISDEVRNATKIVSDLLDFSRTRLAQREESEVPALVARVLDKHPPPEEVQVTTEIAPHLPSVYVDPQQIEMVLGNLVTNAYQAMPEGGQLIIKTSEVAGKPPKSSTSSVEPSGWVSLSITDTGAGISPENMKKIFEPLFTTKAKGIGLGLTVSRNLVEASGGSIEVESEEGVGSTFTVWLPLAEARG